MIEVPCKMTYVDVLDIRGVIVLLIMSWGNNDIINDCPRGMTAINYVQGLNFPCWSSIGVVFLLNGRAHFCPSSLHPGKEPIKYNLKKVLILGQAPLHSLSCPAPFTIRERRGLGTRHARLAKAHIMIEVPCKMTY
jgi:hypothetical protein